MNCPRPQRNSGIALVIVMVTIFVLAVLAGALAYSMKVETRLARNAQHDDRLAWYAYSGVSVARLLIAQSPGPYESLNQFWAGGPGGLTESNSMIASLPLEGWEIGGGSIRFKLNGNPITLWITDEDRKFNINAADEAILRQAMILMGGDMTEASVAVDSILDWIDRDDLTHLNGWESKDYQALARPYFAKNGPLDDLSELLLVHGVSPELYWGPHLGAHPESQVTPHFLKSALSGAPGRDAPVANTAGLVDLFCTLSEGRLNLNTVDPLTLQLLPGMDPQIAAGVKQLRAGADGLDGTEDDVPFINVGEIINAPGMSPPLVAAVQNYLTVRSTTFRVRVEVRDGDVTRQYRAVLRRNAATRDALVMYMEPE